MKYLFLLITCTLLSSGCVRNNPRPVWLKIGAWSLQGNPDVSNEPPFLTHNFTDVSVSVNNRIIGIFEVPCQIPVLASGDLKIVLSPVVRNNGISATKKVYPFCRPFETVVTLAEGETYALQPVTAYQDDVLFAYCEDFSPGTDFSSSSSGYPTRSDAERSGYRAIARGNWYGKVYLAVGNSFWHGRTANMLLPQGQELYLEIDYRSPSDIVTGVIAVEPDGSFTGHDNIVLQAQATSNQKWKKIYIDLKEVVSFSSPASEFVLYLKASLPEGLAETDIFIDNMQVVHF